MRRMVQRCGLLLLAFWCGPLAATEFSRIVSEPRIVTVAGGHICDSVRAEGFSLDDIHFDLAVDGKGKVDGIGSLTVSFDGAESVELAFSVRGITKKRRQAHTIKLKFMFKGTDSSTRRYKGKLSCVCEVQEPGGALVGTVKGKIAITSCGTCKLARSPLSVVSAVEPGDGSWQLLLHVTEEKKRFTGWATITLDDRSGYPFSVKGKYAHRSSTSTLTLKGRDAAKGAKFKIQFSEPYFCLSRVTGKLVGYAVDHEYDATPTCRTTTRTYRGLTSQGLDISFDVRGNEFVQIEVAVYPACGFWQWSRVDWGPSINGNTFCGTVSSTGLRKFCGEFRGGECSGELWYRPAGCGSSTHVTWSARRQ